MSKKEKQFYCRVGQAVCNIFGAIMVFGIPMLACVIAGYIANII